MAARQLARTTENLFRNSAIPTVRCPGNTRDPFSEVPAIFKNAFYTFTIRPWPSFDQEAREVFAGSNSKDLSDATWISIHNSWFRSDRAAASEDSLSTVLDRNILFPVNMLTEEWISGKWNRGGDVVRTSNLGHGNRKPDFHYSTTAATIATGELKTQVLDVDHELAVSHLSRSLNRPLDKVHETNDLNPYFQALSYILGTSRGIGVISNYNESRYLRLDLHRRYVYVSPTVYVNQLLANSKPHALQAMIYASSFRVSGNEFNKGLVDGLYEEFKKNNAHSSTDKESEKQSNRRARSTKSGSSSKTKSRSKNKASSSKRSEQVLIGPSHVGSVFLSSEFIGYLGSGICGDVYEYDYDGVRVAVKVGLPYDYRDDIDAFQHVENEIEVYNQLKHLQGTVIPRVIAAGHDGYVTADGMMLITEKVGEYVHVQDGRLVVGSKEICLEELGEIEEQALNGMRAIYASGVCRLDLQISNMRVEVQDGNVRVWWIDFGNCEISEPSQGMFEGAEAVIRKKFCDVRAQLG